jgi:tRNA U34 5-carboxymethylaminomethyl modifying GTPase MnmE/TrmE
MLRSGIILQRNLKQKCIYTYRCFSVQISEALETDPIIKQCLNYLADLQPLNDRVSGPLDKSDQKNTSLPFVFLLGNHSSGKSSFINYVLQRKVQTAGVAPTDDNFTVIAPGPSDSDRDGPAFIGDPDMGFHNLKSFGPSLIHHTCLKIRSGTAIRDFAIIDSPGMIDSPMVNNSAVMDRGYDFEGVCRWLAQRADVILLFFDPDKPGTTGETLSVLTNALAGTDHKLHIILNKADQFNKMSDFARAYGSLCWNLSKVIQRKDLPRIYTMCLPSATQDTGLTGMAATALEDLDETREDVVAEVLSAPKRRVLNEISRLTDAAHLLQVRKISKIETI